MFKIIMCCKECFNATFYEIPGYEVFECVKCGHPNAADELLIITVGVEEDK